MYAESIPWYLITNCELGTRSRMRAHVASTSAVILLNILKLPNVTWPLLSAGNVATSGLCSGALKQEKHSGIRTKVSL